MWRADDARNSLLPVEVAQRDGFRLGGERKTPTWFYPGSTTLYHTSVRWVQHKHLPIPTLDICILIHTDLNFHECASILRISVENIRFFPPLPPQREKVGWKVHREMCVKYANAAELPPPSPLVNHQKISGGGTRGRRKVIHGGAVGTVSATPRQRENAPTRHPFFGRQESSEREPRAATRVVPVRKKKEQDLQQRPPPDHPQRRQELPLPLPQQQQQQPRHEQLANDEDGCPSPPTMQRLSFPGGNSRTRQGSRSGGARGDSKRSPSSSKSPRPTQHRRQGARGAVAAAVKTAASRMRRSSHAVGNGLRSRGSLSPPPPPPPNGNGGPVRRESAPLYPVALEKSRRRAANLAPSSTLVSPDVNAKAEGGLHRRGPPPPYASVAHRAETIKQALTSTAVGTSASGGPGTVGAAAGSGTKAAGRLVAGVSPALPSRRSSSSEGGPSVARVPPPLPPRTAVSLGDTASPPPGSLSTERSAGTQEEREGKLAGGNEPTAAKDADAPEESPFEKETPGGKMKAWIDGPQLSKREEDGKELAGLREEEDTDEPTPERRAESAQSQDIFDVPQGVGVLSLAKDSTEDAVAGSTAVQASTTVPVRPPSLRNGSSDSLSHDSAAGSTAGLEGSTVPVRPFLARDSTFSLSQDSASGSTAGQEGSTVPVQPSLAKDSANGFSHDSAAASTAGHETSPAPVRPSLAKSFANGFSHDSAAASTAGPEELRLPMEPPPPILPPSATSNTAGLARASNGGVFDSCPPSAGASTKSGSHRSLSVGTYPQFHSMPLVLAAKGIATAAAAAWNADRKTSPRPRPPVSPGPAALANTFRSRKQSAAEPDDDFSKTLPSAFGREMTSASPRSRTASARSFSTGSRRASPRSGMGSPRSPPFVPAVELSPQGKLQTSPGVPGPRSTDTAVFYQERSGVPPESPVRLPPTSRTYLGRPEGFSMHVLMASALTRADLASQRGGLPAVVDGKDTCPRLYYSFEDRGRVAAALQPGDVVMVTPGRYEARAWGLQRLVSSVEIVGAGAAGDCVIYNSPAASLPDLPREHYLLGVMGGAFGSAGGGGGGASVPEVKGKDDVDDDSDSGFEDGALGGEASSIGSFGGRAVRVRLANLTLEQGSGYRGTVYQLGRESHLEMDGCAVVCSQGGVNIDQGTCAIFDSTISGSEAFGVHISGEGAVEHCLIRDCGRGGRQRAEALPPSADGAEAEDDGTDVNRVEGMPAISFLQSSRVRVRFNVMRDNAGHSLQCRDAPLPGGDGKYAMLARRAEAEAEEVCVCFFAWRACYYFRLLLE